MSTFVIEIAEQEERVLRILAEHGVTVTVLPEDEADLLEDGDEVREVSEAGGLSGADIPVGGGDDE